MSQLTGFIVRRKWVFGATALMLPAFVAAVVIVGGHPSPTSNGHLQGPVRQQAYLRALYTLPKVEVHFGNFMVTETRMPLATPPVVGAKTVKVIKTEEKGSDVNLATYLLVDAF